MRIRISACRKRGRKLLLKAKFIPDLAGDVKLKDYNPIDEVKVKSAYEPSGSSGLMVLCSIGILQPPPGWDASPSHG